MSDTFDESKAPAGSVMAADDFEKALVQMAMLSEGINGSNTFDATSAAYGYIKVHERLVVPRSLQAIIIAETKSIVEASALPVPKLTLLQMFSIIYANYVRLIGGDVAETSAFFIAVYRARLIKSGYLAVEKHHRAVTVDEIDWLDTAHDFQTHGLLTKMAEVDETATDADGKTVTKKVKKLVAVEGDTDLHKLSKAYLGARTETDLPVAYMKYGSNAKFKSFLSKAASAEYMAIIKHVMMCAEQYAAITYLLFRQFGHHYKSEYDQKIDIMWKATTIDKSPAYPGHALMNRTAVHSFGLKYLYLGFYRALDAKKLAETFVDRANVAPAGTAVVLTTYAGIEIMKSIVGWPNIYANYKSTIDKLAEQAVELRKDEGRKALKYHTNARLFGFTRFKIDTSYAASLAVLVKGFIQSLGKEADLSKQKALDKYAKQNPVMVKTITKVLKNMANAQVKETRVEDAFPSAMGTATRTAAITSGSASSESGDSD